jgi:hypothetical protein
MAKMRKYLVAGGTFSVAMAIGFVMQNGDALASRMVAEDSSNLPPLAQPLPETAQVVPQTVPQFAPMMPEPVLSTAISTAMTLPEAFVPAEPPVTAPVRMAAAELDAPLSDALPQTLPNATDIEISCATEMVATAGPAATVMLEISAPCAIDAVGTLHHQGMIVSVLTDPQGKASVMVPALAQEAVFIVDLPGGFGAAAIASVSDFDQYDRAVLQWQGDAGLSLHALEFGAGYADDGHVWAASARDVSSAQDGSGGFLIRLGDVPLEGAMIAEVYTYPSGISQRDGTVALSVEAEVLSTNCGRSIAAQSIQISRGQDPQALDLTMTLPGCEAIGEFLVLNNMLRSLTFASR